MFCELLKIAGIEPAEKIAAYLEKNNLSMVNIDNAPAVLPFSLVYGQDVYQLVNKLHEAYAVYTADIPTAEATPAAKQKTIIGEKVVSLSMLNEKDRTLLATAIVTTVAQVEELGMDGLVAIEGIGTKTATRILETINDTK